MDTLTEPTETEEDRDDRDEVLLGDVHWKGEETLCVGEAL